MSKKIGLEKELLWESSFFRADHVTSQVHIATLLYSCHLPRLNFLILRRILSAGNGDFPLSATILSNTSERKNITFSPFLHVGLTKLST